MFALPILYREQNRINGIHHWKAHQILLKTIYVVNFAERFIRNPFSGKMDNIVKELFASSRGSTKRCMAHRAVIWLNHLILEVFGIIVCIRCEVTCDLERVFKASRLILIALIISCNLLSFK